MLSKRKGEWLIVLVTILSVVTVCHAQSRNLLQNPNADQGVALWRAFGEAIVEASTGNDFCFVVRNGGIAGALNDKQ